MFRFLKKGSGGRRIEPSLIKLCESGYCSVVGESFYQDALRATSGVCTLDRDGRRTFGAALIAEPDNPYDPNAIGVHSSEGKIGHLSREDAISYARVFKEIRRLGYDGASCDAYLTGGEPGKPSLGVVLRIAGPRQCLVELRVGAPTAEPTPDPDNEADVLVTLEFRLGNEAHVVSTPMDVRRAGRRTRRTGVSPEDCWHPANTTASVAGRLLTGLVYVGGGLAPADDASYWLDSEPSLIDPALPVGRAPRSSNPQQVWPLAYERLTENQRAAYLDWLAGGRTDPEIGDVYLDLFVAGLERRALVDTGHFQSAAGDLAAITLELERLVDQYGDRQSYRWRALLDTLRVRSLEERGTEIEPPIERHAWREPLELRVALGAYADKGQPLPAEWALAWARCSSQSWLRTPAQRCPDEFAALFTLRYRERHGEGLNLRKLKRRLEVEHYPINAGIRGPLRYLTNLPDVTTAGHVVNPLRELARECTDELDAYSRYLGRNPDASSNLMALALLPHELIDQSPSEQLDALRELIEPLTNQARIRMTADPLITLFAGDVAKLGKKDAVAVAVMLGSLGAALEPDVRFGGDVPSRGEPVVLFRHPVGSAEAPTPEYATAAALLNLAAAVAAADGGVSPEEERLLGAHLAMAPQLEEPERVRLAAHLEWLLAKPPSLRGIKTRVAKLKDAERDAVVGALLTVAGAEGIVGPAEVDVLRRIFAALGLDEALLYQQLHALSTDPLGGPITVREASAADPEYALPPAPGRGTVSLDAKLIEAKLAETAKVSTLLAGIFVDDEQSTRAVEPPGRLGLSAAHHELLRRLGGRSQWNADDVNSLCSELQLLPDGALELINEAAFDVAGVALWQGEDPIEIDPDVVQELLLGD